MADYTDSWIDIPDELITRGCNSMRALRTEKELND